MVETEDGFAFNRRPVGRESPTDGKARSLTISAFLTKADGSYIPTISLASFPRRQDIGRKDRRTYTTSGCRNRSRMTHYPRAPVNVCGVEPADSARCTCGLLHHKVNLCCGMAPTHPFLRRRYRGYSPCWYNSCRRLVAFRYATSIYTLTHSCRGSQQRRAPA